MFRDSQLCLIQYMIVFVLEGPGICFTVRFTRPQKRTVAAVSRLRTTEGLLNMLHIISTRFVVGDF
jgi:hypothetical protein